MRREWKSTRGNTGWIWRCSATIAFIVSVYSFNYTKNSNYISGLAHEKTPVSKTITYELGTTKLVEVIFGEDSMKIVDCYRLDRSERLEILHHAYSSLDELGITTKRTIHSLEGELAAHAYLYDWGIEKASTRDADLDYWEDPRWYVRFVSAMLQILGV